MASNNTTKKQQKKPHKVAKPRKTPSLKQKLKKESKVVKINDLAWKPVEIPDNLGDYTGFFGLEEIDGVDVEVVDGKPQFVVKSEGSTQVQKEQEQEQEQEDETTGKEDQADETPVENEQDENEDIDDEEFTGFDDDEADEDISTKDTLLTEATEKEGQEMSELKHNVFANLDLPMPDDNDINLPQWSENELGVSLSPYTLNGLANLDFTIPTPIQKRTIPIAMEGKDVVGKATTGSGKTLAYGIPILEKYLQSLDQVKQNVKDKKINTPNGIIFTPTRELAHQVVDHLNKLAQYSPLSVRGIVSVTGGLAIQKQQRLLKMGPGIVVATPGRFLELCENDSELLQRMSLTDIVVLDEADRLLQDGHFEEFAKILELFGKNRPKNKSVQWKWQTLVFSATFSRDLFGKLDKQKSNTKGQKQQIDGNSLVQNDEIIELLNEKLHFKDKHPVLIDANPKEIVSGQITEALVECGATERDLYLYYFLLMYKGSTLVFANSIDSVKRLVPLLENLKIPAFAIHSSMEQKQRLRSLERFKAALEKNETAVLVASDVAARGLDIPKIDHVAHYHLPRSADVYIHRSGRTARAGREGVSVMFCSPQEASGPLRKLRKIVASNASSTKRLNAHTDVKLLPIEMDLVAQLRPRIELAGKLADARISSTATRKEDSWVKQAAEDLGVEDLHDLDEFEDDIIKKQRQRQESKKLTKDVQNRYKYELRELLARPIRKNNRRSYLTSGLQNLAHQMVTGKHHEDVVGHEKVNALKDLQKNGSKIKPVINEQKLNKIVKTKEAKQAKKDQKKEAKQKRQELRDGK
ncbi:MAK5 [Candida theae]|uniref:ATP-dependent RNA helicase n=1 Tax=Candida theae TaxID=1198502 RepID=A0AAD5FZC6_9ASCO|nr:MAK5 [Candida theae]KAI5959532.1 MAK5 [Candida theae]